MSYKVFNRFELARLILSSLSGIRYISVDGAGTVFSTGTFILSPGDNITFSTFSNGVSIIGAPGGTVSGFTNTSLFMQTTERNNYFYTSNNTFANSTHTHGNLFLVNMSGTSASSGLTLHVPSVSNAGNVLAAGTQTANTSGTVLFSNSNGVSFGMLGSSVITASFSQQNASVVASLNGSSGSLSLSVSDNLTLSNTNSTIVIGGPKSILHSLQISGNSTLYSGSSPIVNSGVVLAGGDNITLGKSENTIYINAGSITQTVQTQNVVVPALSNTTYTSGTVVFSGLNNLTVSNNGNTINLIGPNTHAQQTGISGIAGSAASTVTSGTIVFANANGISFGLSSNTMTASHNALTSQSIQTQNVHNVIIEGNTTGTTSEISSGTLYLAGGNNITLSQNQNSISIIGGAGSGGLDGLNALVVNSGSSTSATTLTLSNSNNVSFGINAGVITASASYSQYNQVVSAPNGTFSFQTLSLANSNGVSWSTGSQGLYASVNTDYIPSANSSSFMITSERGNYYYTSVSRSLYFADSNGVSFGSSTSGSSTTITASFSGGGGGGGGIGSFLLTGNTTYNTTASGSTIVLSGGNNITLGGTNNSVIRIDGPQGSLYFGNSNGVTFGTSINGISTSVTASFSGGTGGGGGVAVQGSGTYSQNTGTVIFSNSNGVSFGLNTNGVMTASYNSTHTHGNINLVGTNISGSYTSSSNGLTLSFSVNPPSAAQEYNWMSLSGNTSGTNSISGSTILLVAGNNITLSGYSSSRIRIDGPSTSNLALSSHSHGNPTLALTNLSGSTNSNSNGLTLSLSVPDASLYFGNSNGVTFGTSVSGASTTVTASFSGGTGGGSADGYNILAAGTQTANTTGTVIFGNSNSITFGMSNSSVITASFSQSTHDHPFVNTSQSSLFQHTSNTSVITSNALNLSNSTKFAGTGTSATNASITLNSNGLAISVNDPLTTGLVRWGDGNGISFLYSTSSISTTISLSYDGIRSSQSSLFQLTSNTSNITLNAAHSTHSHGNPTLALTNLSGTTASNSNGFTLSLSAAAGGGSGADGYNILAAGTQTANTTGTVVFSNSNGISFGMNNSSVITASHEDRSVYFGTNNGISFTTSSSGNTTTVGPVLNLTNYSPVGEPVTFGAYNSSLFAYIESYLKKSESTLFLRTSQSSLFLQTSESSNFGGYTIYHYDPFSVFATASSVSSHSTNRTFVNNFDLYTPLVFNNIGLLKSFDISVPAGVTTATTTVNSLNASFSFSLFKRSNITATNGDRNKLSLLTTGSAGLTLQYNLAGVTQTYRAYWVTNTNGGTTGWSTSQTTTLSNQSTAFTGIKLVQIPISDYTLIPGEYFIAFKESTSGNSFSYSNVIRNMQAATFGRFGSAAYTDKLQHAGIDYAGNGYCTTIGDGENVSKISSVAHKMYVVLEYSTGNIY